MGALVISIWVSGVVFLALLAISLVKFKSAALAFAISLAFSMGAAAGLFLSLLAGNALLPPFLDANVKMGSLAIIGSAGAIGGAALALSLLRRAAGHRDWERR